MNLIAEIEARAGVGVDPSIEDVQPKDFWLARPPASGPCRSCAGTKQIPITFGSVVITTVPCEACDG
jgi:hypothetical protein